MHKYLVHYQIHHLFNQRDEYEHFACIEPREIFQYMIIHSTNYAHTWNLLWDWLVQSKSQSQSKSQAQYQPWCHWHVYFILISFFLPFFEALFSLSLRLLCHSIVWCVLLDVRCHATRLIYLWDCDKQRAHRFTFISLYIFHIENWDHTHTHSHIDRTLEPMLHMLFASQCFSHHVKALRSSIFVNKYKS